MVRFRMPATTTADCASYSDKSAHGLPIRLFGMRRQERLMPMPLSGSYMALGLHYIDVDTAFQSESLIAIQGE